MNVWVHNLSPFAIRFTETFGVRWYGLAYLAGFIVGWWVIRLIAQRGNSQLKPDDAADFVTYVALGVLAGGRMGYCLFYSPELLVHIDGVFPFWGVLKVNEGGMASHGGILGVMLVCYFYGKKHNISVLHLMDLVNFGGAAGFFFGRLANFVNGELYGREAPEGLSWAVKFPQEMYLWMQKEVGRLPSLANVAETLGKLHTSDGRDIPITKETWIGWTKNFSTDIGSHNAIQQTVEQIIQAIQAGNSAVTEAIAPVLTARYPSQLIQSVLEGLLVFIILAVIWIKPRKPGTIGAMFGILYSLARILGEQYRMPDVQLGFQLWGLTRGQWLSVAMLAVGVGFFIFVQLRDARPMGGWKK